MESKLGLINFLGCCIAGISFPISRLFFFFRFDRMLEALDIDDIEDNEAISALILFLLNNKFVSFNCLVGNSKYSVILTKKYICLYLLNKRIRIN